MKSSSWCCNAEITIDFTCCECNQSQICLYKDKFVITTHPCQVCENPSVEYVNGEASACEVCHEHYYNINQK